MNVAGLLCLIIFFSLGCKSNQDDIAVWIENNSDTNSSIEFTTYLNDSLIDKRMVTRDSIADRVFPFRIKLPSSSAQVAFKFRASDGKETGCLVKLDSMSDKTMVHVNYVEKVFRKGSQFNNALLQKDSVIRNDFYCEVIY